MIEPNLLELGARGLASAEGAGAREAEVFLASIRVLTVRLAGGAVFEVKEVEDQGVGVRVIADGGLGFSSTSTPTQKSISETTERAVRGARLRRIKIPYHLPTPTRPPTPIPGLYDKKLAQLPTREVVGLAVRMIASASKASRKIVDNSGVLSRVVYSTALWNSSGLEARDEGTSLEGSLTSIAKDGTKRSEGAEGLACRGLDDLCPEEVGGNAAKMALEGLRAAPFEEGVYTVIFDHNPAADVTMQVGNLINPFMQKYYSYTAFADKIGRKVGSRKVSVVDDPLLPRGVDSSPLDDEGNPTSKLAIIEEGVLRSFVYDSYTAAVEGKATTGHGYRYPGFLYGFSYLPCKNYSAEPLPKASNLMIVPGEARRDELIEETRDGVLAQRFHYSRLTNPLKGDYTAVLRAGLYNIRRGEVVGALRKGRFLGDIFSVLGNVDMVSREMRVAGGWGEYSHAPTIRTKAKIIPIK